MARWLSGSWRILPWLQAVDRNEPDEDARQIAGEPLAELRPKYEPAINLKTAKALGSQRAADAPRPRRRGDRIQRLLRCDCSPPVPALLGPREMSDLSPQS